MNDFIDRELLMQTAHELGTARGAASCGAIEIRSALRALGNGHLPIVREKLVEALRQLSYADPSAESAWMFDVKTL